MHMPPEQELDAGDRGLSAGGPTATAPSTASSVGAVAVVVASCPSAAAATSSVAATAPSTEFHAARSHHHHHRLHVVAGGNSGSSISTAISNENTDDDVDMGSASGRHWKRLITADTRQRLVNGMLEELRRITGQDDERHLRNCASRYELLVWKKSNTESEYKQKLERRIQSLRRQPSQEQILDTAAALAAAQSNASSAEQLSRRSDAAPRAAVRTEGRRAKHHRLRSSHSASASASLPSDVVLARDEQYFARLRVMKATYRDEVALVFRELCRVNTVIQNSASLRRHESNNLVDFLANLKKIIYLLEQQPDEMHGMIPQRKRTLAYLDVVESHIQRKVLPILDRLRHTYSTILRPLLINYLRNCTRGARRL